MCMTQISMKFVNEMSLTFDSISNNYFFLNYSISLPFFIYLFVLNLPHPSNENLLIVSGVIRSPWQMTLRKQRTMF